MSKNRAAAQFLCQFSYFCWNLTVTAQKEFGKASDEIWTMSKPVVEVQVRAVAAMSGGCAVFLGNEDKIFVMFVDQSVGAAITMFMKGTQKERPLTHGWSLKMTVQEAVAFFFQQKEDPGAACSRSSQVSGIVSSSRAVNCLDTTL